MAYEARRIGFVKGLGDIYQVVAPLYAQLRAFADKGIHTLVSPDEIVKIRLDGIFEDSGARVPTEVSDDFTRTSVMPVALKGELTILCKHAAKIPSLLMNPTTAAVAVAYHKRGKYFSMPKEFYGAARDIAKTEENLELEDRTALIVSQSGDFNLMPEIDEARFILGRRAKEYFEAKKHLQIPLYNLFAPSKDTVINYLWFGAPRGGSRLGCRSEDLNYNGKAFGVLRDSVEGSARKLANP